VKLTSCKITRSFSFLFFPILSSIHSFNKLHIFDTYIWRSWKLTKMTRQIPVARVLERTVMSDDFEDEIKGLGSGDESPTVTSADMASWAGQPHVKGSSETMRMVLLTFSLVGLQ
jgi:hypothetical protein